jgi:hypothetical protein
MTTLYTSNLRVQFSKKGLLNAAADHNYLRKNANVNAEQSTNNYHIVDGKKYEKPDDAHQAFLNYFDNLYSEKKTTSEIVEARKKIKKWSENTDGLEKEFWSNILKSNNPVDDFKKLSGDENIKIKRFNDKKKAVDKIKKMLPKLGERPQPKGMEIIACEKIFKIPVEQKATFSSKQQAKLMRSFLKNNLPDFKEIAISLHHDEADSKRGHVHCYIDGFNTTSKRYDLPDKELSLAREYANRATNNDYYWETDNRKFRELTDNERKQVGEAFQAMFYEYSNNYCKANNIDINFSINKKTPEQIAKNDKMKIENRKPVIEREFNNLVYIQKKISISKKILSQTDAQLKIRFKKIFDNIEAWRNKFTEKNDSLLTMFLAKETAKNIDDVFDIHNIPGEITTKIDDVEFETDSNQISDSLKEIRNRKNKMK